MFPNVGENCPATRSAATGIGADVVAEATKVGGVCPADLAIDPAAVGFELSWRGGGNARCWAVAAVTPCGEGDMAVVGDFAVAAALTKVARGAKVGTRLVKPKLPP